MADFLKYGNAIRLAQLAADPSNPENGLMYYNTNTGFIRQYVNGSWEDVAQGAVDLVGQALNENEVIVGDATNVSAAVDTSAVGDILADSTTGLTVKAGLDAALIADGSVSNAEFQALDGVTGDIQPQIDDVVSDVADLVTLSGVVAGSTDLGTFTGTIISDGETVKGALQDLETFIEALPDPIYYAGTWDASTNTPTLDNSDTGMGGALYRVNVAGSVDFGAGSISFEVGDSVVNNGTIWEKWDHSDQVLSVNGQTGAVDLDSDDIDEGVTNLYFTDERAQDAVGTIFADTASVELVYDDATPEITANVIPGGVDHDALLNYVANEHVDHSTVSIATASNTSGLTGGGDITATRNLSVDINGTTSETSADNADKVLIYDNSATALRSMTRANFLSGIALSSPGDLNESSFTGLTNNTADQVITGFAFNNAVVRSFKAQVSINLDATADSFATYELMGIQRGSDWQMSESYTGDTITGLTFNITSAGQVRVTVGNITGFTGAIIKFRAHTTSV